MVGQYIAPEPVPLCHTTQARRRLIGLLFNHEIKKLIPDYKHHLRRNAMIEEALAIWDNRSFDRIIEMLRRHV